jgi:hypothetical protein
LDRKYLCLSSAIGMRWLRYSVGQGKDNLRLWVETGLLCPCPGALLPRAKKRTEICRVR